MRALDLAQTRKFLSAKEMDLSHNDVFRIYSVLGGIPYYLDALDTKLSPNENLYNLLSVTIQVVGVIAMLESETGFFRV